MKKGESSGNEDGGGRRWRNAGVGGRPDGDGAPGVPAAGTHGAAGDAVGSGGQEGAFGGVAAVAGIRQSSIVGAGFSEPQF